MTEDIVRRALIACFAVLLAGAAQAATIKVLCDGPLAPALPAVGEAFKKKTGHQVEFAFAPSPVDPQADHGWRERRCRDRPA